MKGTTRPIAAAIALAVLGSLALAAGVIDRRGARAQRELAAQHYVNADEALASVERYLAYGRWIPWIGSGPLNDVRTRRAAIRYWSGQYDRVVSDGPDPLTTMSSDDIDRQLIVANAVYQRGVARKGDKQAVLDSLQEATRVYLAVLRNAPPGTRASESAAYNYEYVVRTREDIDKGRHAPELTDNAEDGPAGRKGAAPPPPADKRDLKLLVPLSPGEMDKGIEPGKGGAIERKG
jgi:hypothetical protein